MNVCVLAALEEDIGFIEQNDGTPTMCKIEDAVERLFETEGLGAEFADGYLVEWTFEEFGDTCGQLVRTFCAHVEREDLPSAVRVLPVPGGPWRTATRPLPCKSCDEHIDHEREAEEYSHRT